MEGARKGGREGRREIGREGGREEGRKEGISILYTVLEKIYVTMKKIYQSSTGGLI